MRLTRLPAFLRDGSPPDRLRVAGRDYPLIVRRHPRARHIKLRADPVREALVLTVPPGARLAEAIAFAQGQQAWIEKAFAAAGPRRRLVDGGTLPYRGVDRFIAWSPSAKRRVLVDGDRLVVGGPGDALESRLLRWLHAEARAACRADLDELCERAGETAAPLALSNAARRWGSCAADRTIRINWRLIMAPDWVRRAVVAHEVAHLRHRDHSPAFYAWLDRIGDGTRRGADDWLKANGPILYRVGPE